MATPNMRPTPAQAEAGPVSGASAMALVERYRVAIVGELRTAFEGREHQPYGLMRYHLGWQDRAGQSIESPGGKLLRPALCLLCCEAVGGDWRRALPAAAALELIHNFTLIHDDVEDASTLRHGRETIWSIWGEAQAINTGDGMFALAHSTLLQLLDRGYTSAQVLRAIRMLDEATLRLCEGQHIDITAADDASNVNSYLSMIEGKTAALLAASCGIGALLGGDSVDTADHLHEYGRHTGLAFQIRDDLLGVWGNVAETGKPAGDDLREGKRSYPVVIALERASAQQQAELLACLSQGNSQHALAILEELDARKACEVAAMDQAEAAIEALKNLPLDPDHRGELEGLARFAAERRS